MEDFQIRVAFHLPEFLFRFAMDASSIAGISSDHFVVICLVVPEPQE
jgi:hypothetical protein